MHTYHHHCGRTGLPFAPLASPLNRRARRAALNAYADGLAAAELAERSLFKRGLQLTTGWMAILAGGLGSLALPLATIVGAL